MHGGREPGDFDYLWAGKKGTTMIKGAIFDMDGTLVDNTPVHIRAFEIFCERYGIRDWKEKLGQAYGMGNDDIMRLIMPAEVIREKGLAALAEEKESIYREIYAPEIVPMPGLTDLLQRLRDAGIRCAVGSSGYKPNVDFVLEKCRIEPYFDARISGDMVSRCKPDPEIYLTAAAALGLGSCWINRAMETFELPEGKALLAEWGLGENWKGVGNCILGYTDQAVLGDKARKEDRVLYV